MERRLNGSRHAASAAPGAASSWRHRVLAIVRLGFAAAIMGAFVCGVLAGLARFGFSVPNHALSKAAWHGVLMLPVFFGAVVSLERAVALGGGPHWMAPIGAAAGGVLLLAGAQPVFTQALLLGAATIACASVASLLRRQPALHLCVLALGVFAWWFGDSLWLVTGSALEAVPSWVAFLVLTIAAERLELTRMRPTPRRANIAFVAVITIMLAAVAVSPRWPELALRTFSACLVALAAWLARYDIARVTVRGRGLPRFIAACLLSGYAWLALSGALGLSGAWGTAHPWHDAALHALMLGFVMSMALGHAPIVLPALTRVRVAYRPFLYLPLVALHTALAVRVGGSLIDAFALRRAGALANAGALLTFVVAMIAAAAIARRDRRAVSNRR